MSCGYRSDFQKIVAKITALDYTIPDKLQLSDSAKHLIAQARPFHSLESTLVLVRPVLNLVQLHSRVKAGAGRSRFRLSAHTVST